MVSRSGCDAHTDPVFKELKYLKLNGIHLLQLGQFMYSFSTCNLPTKFDSFFSVNKCIHSYNTRHASFFRLPLCRTNIRQFSIFFQGPKFLNTLSSEIKKFTKSNVLYIQAERFLNQQLLTSSFPLLFPLLSNSCVTPNCTSCSILVIFNFFCFVTRF